jgi:hypothetical protein
MRLVGFLNARDKFWNAWSKKDLDKRYTKLLKYKEEQEEVQWLEKLVMSSPVQRPFEYFEWLFLFKREPVEDYRAHYYFSRIRAFENGRFDENLPKMIAAATHGYAPAAAFLATWTSDNDDEITYAHVGSQYYTRLASDAGDRDGLFLMGLQVAKVEGYKDKAKSYFYRAAVLGLTLAMQVYAKNWVQQDSLEYFEWMGRAKAHPYYTYGTKYVALHSCDDAIIYVIGKYAPKQNVNYYRNYKSLVRARQVYEDWFERAKLATFSWMHCSRQLGMCKDVARLIGTLVWAQRGDWFSVPKSGKPRRQKKIKR